MPKQIAGVLPIAHTPFDDDDHIDVESLERQIDWAYEQGADGFCTGMVSELLRLSADERIALTRMLGEMNAGRGVFVAGVGAESTTQAVAFAQSAQKSGADALMAIPPITSAASEPQLERYFRSIADATELPLIIQDASGYVGQPIPLPLCIRLLDDYGEERLLFKPEASPLGPNLSILRDATDRRARIFEGSGGISLIDSYRRGIAGTIPGMEFLKAIVAIWKALSSGDEERAYQIYLPVCALVAIQLQAGLDGFLAVEKYVLHERGIFATDRRRQPFQWSMDEETRLEVDRLLERLDRELAQDS